MPLESAVVVTGLGAITPLGPDVPSLWAGLLAGRSGVRRLDEPWAADLPVRIGAPIAGPPAELLGRGRSRTLDRVQQFALTAAREAWADAGTPAVDPDRLAVVVGSGVGGFLTLLQMHDALNQKGSRAVTPHSLTMFMPDGPAVTVGLEVGARAGVHTPVSACASGAEAVALGLDLIRAGRADVVLCGGAEAAVNRLPIAGFASIRALSQRTDPQGASRPFDRDRDGFVLGEGAGMLVLESAQHAARRGRVGYVELAGAGVTADAHHVVAPDPSGAGAARAMRSALRQAGVDGHQVVHVNAHATSTPLGDVAEAAAIRLALGRAADRTAVSATKSMTGHLLGASGAVAAVATVLALTHSLAPATTNLEHLDERVELDVVTGTPRPLPEGVALTNSFGFGGHNAALAFRSSAATALERRLTA